MREWFKQIRHNKNMKQKDIAILSGIDKSTINKIELGIRRPSIKVAKRIASVLGFDWTRFYEDESPNDSHEHEKEAI